MKLALVVIAALIVTIPFLNYAIMARTLSAQIQIVGSTDTLLSSAAPQSKSQSISSYWWPSAEENGGLLGRLSALQNPADCSSPSTRFFVWRSKMKYQDDTRGLTAWAHAATSHLLHALTDGDQVRFVC
jgi:hypothetical protein